MTSVETNGPHMASILELLALLLAFIPAIYTILHTLGLTMSHSPDPPSSSSRIAATSKTTTSHSSQREYKTYPQFLLLGDSITQGSLLTLTARLSEWYSRRLDVLNRGFGGYTAPMGYEVLQQFFPSNVAPSPTSPKVQLITIFFGANDACVPGNPQHVPLPTYTSSLKSIINYPGLKLHDTQIILITPPPVDEWQFDHAGDRTAEHTAKYARACREFGEGMGLPVLDLWTIFMRKAGWTEEDSKAGKPLTGSKDAQRNEVLGKLLSDGLHFTDKAYELMFEEFVKVIQGRLPHQLPENLPMIFPDWRDKLGIEW